MSEANGVEKSGLTTIYPDFSTSAAPQPSLEMTIFLSFLQSSFKFQILFADFLFYIIFDIIKEYIPQKGLMLDAIFTGFYQAAFQALFLAHRQKRGLAI